MNAVAIPQLNNPLYPLPPDYEELTREGMRQARVNACRQWLPETGCGPNVLGRGFAAGVNFFDQYYLWPDHGADWDPLFYDDDPALTPDFHGNLLRLWGSSRKNLAIAPRGSAKSFLFRKSTFVRLLARPVYTIIYATSSMDNCTSLAQAIKTQITENDRINDDWGPEFPDGRIKPTRGEMPFGTEFLCLKNGSWLRTISAESKQRGGRPRRYVLDDPEYDEKAATSMQLIRDYMERLLFKVVLPMVMRRGCGVDWLATFVSRRHYAWHAMQTTQEKDGSIRAIDPRFNHWNRMIVKAAVKDDDGKMLSCWPDMWPISIEEKQKNPRWHDRVSLEEIEQEIGSRNFASEYMANPGAGEDTYFPELTEKQHGYTIKGADELLTTKPYRSQAEISWFSVVQDKQITKTMEEFLRDTRLFMTVDTSYTATADSDSKVCNLMGVNSDNDLFVLDLWSKRCQQPILVEACMKMADKWLCPVIWVEGIREGLVVFQDLDDIRNTRAREMMGVTHLPAIKKFNPGNTEKSAKIASLHRRFEFGQIKFPLWRKMDHPWRSLFNQIGEFNPDAPDGGLQHDDEIDTTCMSMYVLKGRLAKVRVVPPDERTPLQKLADGETKDRWGRPLGLMVDWSNVPTADILKVLNSRSVEPPNGKSKV